MLDWRMREPPGARFEYVSGGVILLGAVVGRATGARVDQWLDATLFAPLGVEGVRWERGLPDGFEPTQRSSVPVRHGTTTMASAVGGPTPAALTARTRM